MNKKLLILGAAAVFFGVIIVYPYLKWNDPFAYLDDIPGYLKPVTDAFARIPEPIQKILQVISIPSIISGIFFAWTKLKAMQKLNETKLEASEKITQIEGESQTKISELEGQITTLQGQAGEGVAALSTKLSEAQTTITSKEKQIQQLINEKNEAERLVNVIMHPTTDDLKRKLEQAGYTITRTVT